MKSLFMGFIIIIKADVNRAINILRKVIDNSFIDSRYRLLATQPVTVNPL
jgi:hypothetical protein